MQVLVGGNNCRRQFLSFEQRMKIFGDEIGVHLRRDEITPVLSKVANADEIHQRMARGDLAAKESDPSRADYREADALRIFLGHGSGSVTGALLSADWSAAMYTSMTMRACSGVTITGRS